jgi:hypothetical protein
MYHRPHKPIEAILVHCQVGCSDPGAQESRKDCIGPRMSQTINALS